MIKIKPSITRKKIVERTGISVNGIKYHLDKLKKSGKIKHVGALKKWILEDNFKNLIFQ